MPFIYRQLKEMERSQCVMGDCLFFTSVLGIIIHLLVFTYQQQQQLHSESPYNSTSGNVVIMIIMASGSALTVRDVNGT